MKAALAAALVLRLAAMAASDRVAADVERYRKVGDHVLDVSWNPYQAPRLYPYPPAWVWIEAGATWLARRTGLSFPALVKLPVLAADLGIVALLARMGGGSVGALAAWGYALHPVSLLVGGFHGQFDALALALVLLSLRFFDRGRPDASALALAGGIAVKSFPVLLVPLFAWTAGRTPRARLRYVLLATAPVAAALLPYAVHDLPAVRRELLGYRGVADFGWIGVVRGWSWLAGLGLARAEALHWPVPVAAGRWLFLAGYAAIVLGIVSRRLRWTRDETALAVFLAFLGLYGALSAQYLLWIVPLALLRAARADALFAAAATLGLLGFYDLLAPGVLTPAGDPLLPRRVAGALWATGASAALAACWIRLGGLVLCGRSREADNATEAQRHGDAQRT